MNALKHGILSRQVLVKGLAIDESGEELEALHRRFWEDLKPVGVVEEMLVDQIVTGHWRLRRALTAEAGKIAHGVDESMWKRHHGHGVVVQQLLWNASLDPAEVLSGKCRAGQSGAEASGGSRRGG